MKLADLHVHSLLSDGGLLPIELARRMEKLGYWVVAIADHIDWSNVDTVRDLARLSEEIRDVMEIEVIPAAELTHVPPSKICELARRARQMGARIIVVHGETIVEPVKSGTNRAALECGEVDILAHPGLIDEEEVEKAKSNGVYLELTSRKGHCLANGWVARMAKKVGAKLLLNSDAHSPNDLLSEEMARKVIRGAGLEEGDVEEVLIENPHELVRRVG